MENLEIIILTEGRNRTKFSFTSQNTIECPKIPGKNFKFNGDLNWFLRDPYERKIIFSLFYIIFS